MLSEKMPILSGTIPSFEMFMTAWEQLGGRNPHLKNWTKIGLEWAVKYYMKMDKMHAYTIAMGEFMLFPALALITDYNY